MLALVEVSGLLPAFQTFERLVVTDMHEVFKLVQFVQLRVGNLGFAVLEILFLILEDTSEPEIEKAF